VNVSLTPQLEDLIRAKVESGLYHTASEVVREGLRLLEERDRLRAMRMEELRAKIQLGIDQAEAGELSDLDIEAVIEKAREVRARRSHKESA
jgi:antitoxin ParD1/3/4